MVARVYTLAYVHTPATPATPPQRVCAAAAASGQRAAAVRFWLTSGSGDFHWLPEHPSEGVGVGAFYCAVFSADGMEMPDASRVRDASGVATLPAHTMWPQRTPLLRVSTDGPQPTHPPTYLSHCAVQGIHEFTVSDAVPWKPPLLASTKSNNYMLNCMMGMVSRERGGWFGIGVDASGNIGESCVGNVAAVVEVRQRASCATRAAARLRMRSRPRSRARAHACMHANVAPARAALRARAEHAW